jgi:hypothetical protein
MAKHTIFDYEIDSIMKAANQLFSPVDGGGDDRAMFQQIYYTLDEVKNRLW